MTKLITLLLFLCPAYFLTAQTKEAIQATDMLQIKTAGNIVMSDDGTKAVFTVLSIEPDSAKWEHKYITQLWMVATDGSQPRQLTFAKEGASQPVWSHDGKKLAFVRVAEGRPQIFLLPVSGGEAMQLTKFKYGAAAPVWTKDDKQILFSAGVPLKDLLNDTMLNATKQMPAWPFEKPGFANNSNLRADSSKPNPDGSIDAIRAYLAGNEKDNKAKVFDKLRFQEESTTSSNISFNHFFITDAVAGATPKAVTQGFYSFSNAQFISTNAILLETNSSDTAHPDRKLESSICRVNKDGSGMNILLSEKDRSFSSATPSASGKWLAYLCGKPSDVSIPAFTIIPQNGNSAAKMVIPVDRNISTIKWSKDENYLYFTSASNGGNVLSRFNLKTKKIEVLTDVNIGVTSFALSGDKLLFSKTAVENPSEIYLADMAAKNQQRISVFNTGWLQNKKLSFPEKHSFVNEKGLTVEYWVMKPTNFEPGKKHPLLLEIHGGPAAMWGPGEAGMWHEYQYFCARGYGVVYSNPRGSGGYGVDFLRGNIADWGNGPTSDVLTALDKTVAEGWADTSKLLVTGGSYAGYLVAWIVGHDHRFKAACSQRGVYDLSTFFGEGNAWRLVPNYFGGYPWQKDVKTLLDKESPINYVQNITTPYIIFHGENDLRTGVIQGEMLYKSLKVLGRPVEYVRHPGATHELTRSGNNRQRIDQLLRTYEFFERFIH